MQHYRRCHWPVESRLTYDFNFGSSFESMRASVHLSKISFTKQLRLTDRNRRTRKECERRDGLGREQEWIQILFAESAFTDVVSSPLNLPAHGMDVRIAEHLVAFLADAIQSGELGLVVDTHAAQTDETPLVQIGGINEGILFQDDGKHESEKSSSDDRIHD